VQAAGFVFGAGGHRHRSCRIRRDLPGACLLPAGDTDGYYRHKSKDCFFSAHLPPRGFGAVFVESTVLHADCGQDNKFWPQVQLKNEKA
jgi:hypothetical protein